VSVEPAAIDLGEFGVACEPNQNRGAYGVEPEHPPRGRPPPRVRPWLPAAVVAALVAPLAGAAPPGEPPLTPLWTVVGSARGSVALSGEALYAVTATDRGTALARHGLADGAVRWATPLTGGPRRTLTLADGVPVLFTPTVDGVGHATGYDPETGEARWRHEGWPGMTVTGGRLALERWPAGPPDEDGRLQSPDLVAVDVHTGEIGWTIQTEGDEQQLYGWSSRPDPGGEPTDLVTLTYDGRMTRYDLATGAMLATTDLPGQPYYTGVGGSVPAALFTQLHDGVFAPELAHPAVAGGLVLVSDAGIVMTAYDLATLTPRWRLRGYRSAAPCGPVVCAVDGDLSELVGADPVTGSARWSWRCDREGGASGPCYVLPTAQGPDDPILVQQWELGPGGVDTAWLVEPATGTTVARLGQWRALGRLADGWLLRWVDGDEPVFGRSVPPERIWLARLTVDPVRLDVLGSAEAATCQPHRTYLVCRPDEQADAVVWRVG
jgi:outer membrane protein assembly factor BamB